MSKIRYVTASKDSELSQILKLQKANLPKSLTKQEKQSEGFVTVSHSLELLKAMHMKCPHILAKSENQVVGYALCMHPDFRHEIAVLKPMFREIEKILATNASYLIMGQICIAKAHRKQGVFRGLYKKMKESTRKEYPYIITEVDSRNQRSLQAHYAVGFRDLCQYKNDGREWFLILLK